MMVKILLYERERERERERKKTTKFSNKKNKRIFHIHYITHFIIHVEKIIEFTHNLHKLKECEKKRNRERE